MLEPFPYHKQVVKFLKSDYRIWSQFSDKNMESAQISEYKNHLLKNTIRLDKEGYPLLYELSNIANERLEITPTPTFYQAMDGKEINLSVVCLKNEVHIVISGELLDKLDRDELLSVISHEMAHYLLFELENKDYEKASRCINTLDDKDTWNETARKYNLYTELYCDLASLKVLGDIDPLISALVKISSSLSTVNVESYIKQALEIIENSNDGDSSQTHPKNYTRTLSLYFAKNEPDNYLSKVDNLIQGTLEISTLDVFQQKIIRASTKELIKTITEQKMMKSELVDNLKDQYTISKLSDNLGDTKLLDIVNKSGKSIKNYFCYILMDFCFVDSNLEDIPLAHALNLANDLSLNKEFETILRKEKHWTIRKFKMQRDMAIKSLDKA